MRPSLAALLATLCMAGLAEAQTQPTSSATTPPAVSMGNAESKTTAAPVAGANSFTEAQARDRLAKHGYTDVSGMKQDGKSVWHGMATKDGRQLHVAVDYQGNIVGQ